MFPMLTLSHTQATMAEFQLEKMFGGKPPLDFDTTYTTGVHKLWGSGHMPT